MRQKNGLAFRTSIRTILNCPTRFNQRIECWRLCEKQPVLEHGGAVLPQKFPRAILGDQLQTAANGFVVADTAAVSIILTKECSLVSGD